MECSCRLHDVTPTPLRQEDLSPAPIVLDMGVGKACVRKVIRACCSTRHRHIEGTDSLLAQLPETAGNRAAAWHSRMFRMAGHTRLRCLIQLSCRP